MVTRQEFDTALTDLQGKVTRLSDVEGSAITLLQGITQQLQNAITDNDMASVRAIAESLQAKTDELAAAVAAAGPAPSPAP